MYICTVKQKFSNHYEKEQRKHYVLRRRHGGIHSVCRNRRVAVSEKGFRFATVRGEGNNEGHKNRVHGAEEEKPFNRKRVDKSFFHFNQ